MTQLNIRNICHFEKFLSSFREPAHVREVCGRSSSKLSHYTSWPATTKVGKIIIVIEKMYLIT